MSHVNLRDAVRCIPGARRVKDRVRRVWFSALSHIQRSSYLSEEAFTKSLCLSTENWLAHFSNRSHPIFFINPRKQQDTAEQLKHLMSGDSLRQIFSDADRICRHEFDLLGSGVCRLGKEIDWQLDFKSGARWDAECFSKLLPYVQSIPGSDIKIPWELSRFQHVPTLGKAYWLSGDLRYATEFVTQFESWHRKNPPKFGVNWICTMDVSIRAVNLIWGYYFFSHSEVFSEDVHRRFLCAMYEHAEFIVHNLEYGFVNGRKVTSNHFLANIVGLIYIGVLFPEFKVSQRWRDTGLEALTVCMEEQVHSDGVNFESSTSYHRLVLELFVSATLLCRLNDIELPHSFYGRLEKMFDYVLCYTRPDGRAPQIGDADDGRLHILSNYGFWDRTDHRYLLSIGAVLFGRADMKTCAGQFFEDAFWLLDESGFRRFQELAAHNSACSSKGFSDAGTYVMRQDSGYLVINAGQVGTRGIGNHKHNDLLSVELYVFDKPFIVDPGTYTYTADARMRNLFRSSVSHNTVVVDREEINRFKPHELFRMRADAVPRINEWIVTDTFDLFDAQHDGYRRLTCPVAHRRIVYFNKTAPFWIIRDILEGEGEHLFEQYFHFAPMGLRTPTYASGFCLDVVYNDSKVQQLFGDVSFSAAQGVETECDGARLVILSGILHEKNISEGWISRSYGVKQAAPILKYIQHNRCPTEFLVLLMPFCLR